MSFITTKFHEILLSGFRGVALTNCFSSIFHFGRIYKFKKGVIRRKKINQNLDMHIYTLCPSQQPDSRNSVSGFREEPIFNIFHDLRYMVQNLSTTPSNQAQLLNFTLRI